MTQAYFIDPPAVAPVIVGRSELERAVECPHQAALIDRGMASNMSRPAIVGDIGHDIIARGIAIRSTDGVTPSDLNNWIKSEAAKSRPDVQPDVVDALKWPWPLVERVCYQAGYGGNERNPADLLRYDGGQAEHAGQLAWDILPADEKRGPVRLTCEADLLMSTESPEELDLDDWKTGHTHWTSTDVKASFQFGFYAALVMFNYPRCRRVNVRVWNTREGKCTPVVEFDRGKDLDSIYHRLLSAVGVYLKYRDAEIADVPAWPLPERCALCPGAMVCKLVHKPRVAIEVDPEGFFEQFTAIEAAYDQMKAMATTARRERGADFVLDGVGFGVDDPGKKAGTPQCKLYTIKAPKRDFGKAPAPAAV